MRNLNAWFWIAEDINVRSIPEEIEDQSIQDIPMTFMDVYHYLGDRTVPLLKGGALAWFRNILFNPDRQINQGDHGDFGAIITAFLLSNGAFLVLRFPLDDTTKAVDCTTNSGFAF